LSAIITAIITAIIMSSRIDMKTIKNKIF